MDWGCGTGNFLTFSNESEKFDYLGCDVDQERVEGLKRKFPEHQFVHFPKYNRQYNHGGHRKAQWPLKEEDRFNRIILFSVATHLDLAEIRELVDGLRGHLDPKGEILLSIFNTERSQTWTDIVEYRYEFFGPKSLSLWDTIKKHRSTYISVTAENEVIVETDVEVSRATDCQYFISFFDPVYLAQELGAQVLPNSENFNSKIMDGQLCLRIIN